jgi:hypothetical protein
VAFRTLWDAAWVRDFWLISGVYFVSSASTMGLIGTHLIPACVDHGLTGVTAVGLLAATGVFAIVIDDVAFHRVGKVNPDLPLARGLRYFFLPLALPGCGDPRLPVQTYSLRALIKTAEAVFVAGRSVTHEQLVKWLSQQMGSAHEGDAISPILAERSTASPPSARPTRWPRWTRSEESPKR